MALPQSGQAQDLFDLSLEELSSLRVSIASKRDEAVHNAPGVITVITAKELNRYGARNLHDAMRLIPAIQRIYPQFTHRNSVSVRGISSGALDKYLLTLLNGKPLRDPILSGVNAPVYEGIPLELIERIEIIRGPGSVIYGSNAFAGVMDIITKEAGVQLRNTLNLRRGSSATDIQELFLNKKFDNGLGVVAALRGHASDGWALEFTDTGGNKDTFNNDNDAGGGFLELSYGGFSASLFKADVEERATLSNGLIADATPRASDKLFYSLEYKADINAVWSLQADYSINRATVAATTEYDAEDSVYEVISHAQYTATSLDLGARVRRNKLVTPAGGTASDVFYHSVFAQLSSNITDALKVIVGLQAVDPDSSEIQYAPRLSFIAEFDQHYHAKLMYGRAYSSPTGVEFSLDLPGLFSGNTALVPTTIDNYDLQLSYNDDELFAAFNVFYSDIKNTIELVEVTPGQALPKQFQNVPSEHHRGFELELKYNYSPDLQFLSSYSYQTSNDLNGRKDTKLLSNTLLKAGFSYNIAEPISLSVFNVYRSQPNNREPLVNEFNEPEASYSHLTINLNYQLPAFSRNDSSLSLNVFVDNALNSDAIFMPDPTLSNLNTMPKVAGRAYYLGLKLNF